MESAVCGSIMDSQSIQYSSCWFNLMLFLHLARLLESESEFDCRMSLHSCWSAFTLFYCVKDAVKTTWRCLALPSSHNDWNLKLTMENSLYFAELFIGYIYIHTVVAKIVTTLVFSPAKHGFKSVIIIFCCSVSVENISLHFQTFILPFILILQWDFCLHKESDNSQRSDLIIIRLSGMTWRNRRNWDRINPEELWQHLQDVSRNLPAKLQYCSQF